MWWVRSTWLALAVLFAACSAKPPQFFQLKALTSDRVSGGSYVKEETFVVANAPQDRSALKLAVEAFDHGTLTEGDVLGRTRYTRWFFRESRALPRDYRGNAEDWGGNDINDHLDDLLLEVSFSKGLASARYTFYEHGVAQ